MGGSLVYFDKSKGANFTKGRKRMRGEIDNSPEVKKWNCFLQNATFNAVDFTNMLIPPSGSFGSFQPARLQWPNAGSTDGFRIGSNITFLGFRLKGWITLTAHQLKQIRWRLVLCRVDIPTGSLNFDATSYLTQFRNSDTAVPSAWSKERFESFSRHNFYKKFKDVSNSSFKTKVIASGVLPPTNDYRKMYLSFIGVINGANANLVSNPSANSYSMAVHSGNVGYLPIDIKVKLNDTVNCVQDLRRYFIVLETDCGYGWTDEGEAVGTESAMLLNVYCRGYFTDV